MRTTFNSNPVHCVVCGNEVDDPDVQLCDNDDCIEQFSDIYLQVCY